MKQFQRLPNCFGLTELQGLRVVGGSCSTRQQHWVGTYGHRFAGFAMALRGAEREGWGGLVICSVVDPEHGWTKRYSCFGIRGYSWKIASSSTLTRWPSWVGASFDGFDPWWIHVCWITYCWKLVRSWTHATFNLLVVGSPFKGPFLPNGSVLHIDSISLPSNNILSRFFLEIEKTFEFWRVIEGIRVNTYKNCVPFHKGNLGTRGAQFDFLFLLV